MRGAVAHPREGVGHGAYREVDTHESGLWSLSPTAAAPKAYPDGEVRQQFAVCFHAHVVAGDVHPDLAETSAAGWFHPHVARELSMHPTMRQRLEHALSEPHHAHFD